MNFGSKFVFNYSDSEEEVVSEEEYEEGLNVESHGKERQKIKRKKQKKAPTRRSRSQRSSTSDPDRSAEEDIVPVPSTEDRDDDGRYENPDKPRYINVSSSSSDSHRSKSGRPLPLPPAPAIRARSEKNMHHWEESGKHRYESVKGRKWRRADTNVVSIKFGDLRSAVNMHTGDPVTCQSCGAVLSSYSKLEDTAEAEKVWVCEYCSERNLVDIVDEEIPTKEDITFMLEPAPTTTSGGRLGLDDILVVFCVDVSGSMCVTTEVPGKVKLRGDHLDRLQSLNTERESQYMPGQSRNVTFVSRLQGVQAAVDYQLGEMAKNHPDRRVALITFNNEVTMAGVGDRAAVNFSGDKLKSWEEMKKCGMELGMPESIKSTRSSLSDRLFDLEEGGQTALGPALLLAVSVASQVSGSKVIICTDGMANIGLGALDNVNNEDDFENASAFYENVSQFASDKGVSVSVTTIKGTDCKLMELGQVAANTHGQVNIVDPLKLTQEFGNILADATIATNVNATLVLHKGLYFRNEDINTSSVSRHIGNVNKDTEITFEYGVKRKSKKKAAKATVTTEATKMKEEPMDTSEAPPVVQSEGATGATATSDPAATSNPSATSDTAATSDASSSAEASSSAAAPSRTGTIDELSALPFQVQIRYTDLDGGKGMRIITQLKPVTKDRMEAEREMDPVLMGVHATKKSASMALDGDYTKSRLNAFMHQRLMYRNVDRGEHYEDAYNCYLGNVLPMDNALQEQQRSEVVRRGRTYSDSEGDEEEAESEALRAKAPTSLLESLKRPFMAKKAPKKKLAGRHMECKDDAANAIYAARNTSSSSSAWKKK